jgi:hypothetical protein
LLQDAANSVQLLCAVAHVCEILDEVQLETLVKVHSTHLVVKSKTASTNSRYGTVEYVQFHHCICNCAQDHVLVSAQVVLVINTFADVQGVNHFALKFITEGHDIHRLMNWFQSASTYSILVYHAGKASALHFVIVIQFQAIKSLSSSFSSRAS